MRSKILLIAITVSCSIALASCKKYLSKSPNNHFTIPSTLEDFQQLLDNEGKITQYTSPSLGDIGSDVFFLTYENWRAQFTYIQNSYLWAKDIFEGQISYDWNNMYQAVYYANVVLDGLKNVNVSASNRAEFNQVRGTALFYRAFTFYNIEETFGQPYRPKSIQTDLGIPLRLSSKPGKNPPRSTVKEVYNQIIKDLLSAKELLPNTIDFTAPNRPSKVVAYACLARVYLTQQDYQKALDYADSSLAIYSTLVDYNTIDPTPTFPLSTIDEVMYDCSTPRAASLHRWTIDSTFYQSYCSNDLRKNLFFTDDLNQIAFVGTYTKDGSNGFNGFATDEMYLIKAECEIRLGNVHTGMKYLNKLLQKRWRTGTFEPYTATNKKDALEIVLLERRKELLFRGLRWADLRRLNQDPETAVTINRRLNGETYTLPPNDPRYAYPIPPEEISLTGVQQNKR